MLGEEDIAGWLLSTPAKSRIKAKQAKTSWQFLAYFITNTDYVSSSLSFTRSTFTHSL